MNDHPQSNGTSRGAGSSGVMGFVLGALVGAGIALLLAPRTGKETRRGLADAGRRWGGAVRDALGQAAETVNDLAQDAEAALDAGREAFEEGRESQDPPSPSGPARMDAPGGPEVGASVPRPSRLPVP